MEYRYIQHPVVQREIGSIQLPGTMPSNGSGLLGNRKGMWIPPPFGGVGGAQTVKDDNESQVVYDYMIVGGGPAGLTTAWILAQYGFRSLIVERELEIGGCHRVRRVNGLFTEHGPRIYSDAFLNFKKLLDEFGHDFYKLFRKYRYSFGGSAMALMRVLSLRELYWLSTIHISELFKSEPEVEDNNFQQATGTVTMGEFMTKHRFSRESYDLIDSYCRLTDGAGADRYTTHQFVKLLDQIALYNFFEPVVPNDSNGGLFTIWRNKLEETGLVDIWTNCQVVGLEASGPKTGTGGAGGGEEEDDDGGNKIVSAKVMKDESFINIRATRYILAVPPRNLQKIISESKSKLVNSAFGNPDEFAAWAQNSTYVDYITVVFHWNRKIVMPDVGGFLYNTWNPPRGAWKIAHIVMSDYTDFNNPNSRTVITAAVSDQFGVSEYLGKSAAQCTGLEIKEEVLRVLREMLPLPEPTAAIISPGTYKQGDHWICEDTAFIATTMGFIKQRSSVFGNLFTVGAHTGRSRYEFTSMEAAVSNAMFLCGKLIGGADSEHEVYERYKILTPKSFYKVARWWLFTIILMGVVAAALYAGYKKWGGSKKKLI